MLQPLKGKIVLVAGATRGAGRAIAVTLGEAGATVYCTGRSVRGKSATGNRPETIEETAELVTAKGGNGIWAQVDHAEPEQVKALIERIRAEQGRLDILINNAWGGNSLMEWGKPFWEHDLNKGMMMQRLGLHTHLITAYYAAPLLVQNRGSLLIEVTDGDTDRYRETLFYDLVKSSLNRLGMSLAEELRPFGVTALAVTPGFLRSEEMLDYFGVTEANWQEGAKVEPDFIASETPYFVGRAILALVTDPNIANKAGGVYSSWGLSDEYGFKDIDGRSPHWGRYYVEHVEGRQPKG